MMSISIKRYNSGKEIINFVIAAAFMFLFRFIPKNLGGVTLFVTTKVTIIGWMVLMLAIMMFVKIDGKCLLEPKVMAASFPWDLLLMIGVGVTIGTLVTGEGTGVAVWFGQVLGPILAGMNDWTLYIVLAIVGIIMTNLLNNNAVAVILSSTVVSMYGQGFITDPIMAILVVIVSTGFGFLTPASSMYGAMIHGHKYVTPEAAYRYGFILAAFSFALLIILFIPLSRLIF